MKQLVITADDFGASPEVNEAVEAAHRRGVLTAASLMVGAPAAADAVARARALPELRVGLHLVLAEGRPLLPARAVTRLIDAHGNFRSDMTALGFQIALSAETRRQLAAEIGAQFAAFHATGLALDHCNAHKHFHLHPMIAAMLVDIGARFGLTAVRVPDEPLGVLRAVEPGIPWDPQPHTAICAALLRRRLRAAGCVSPDQVFGLAWSGRMNRTRLLGLIEHLPEGLSEIYLHPATGSYAGAAEGYGYRDEFEALTAPDVIAACRADDLQLGGFRDFVNGQPMPAPLETAAPAALANPS